MMDKINELLNEATKIDKEVNGEKEVEKRERELMEEEKIKIRAWSQKDTYELQKKNPSSMTKHWKRASCWNLEMEAKFIRDCGRTSKGIHYPTEHEKFNDEFYEKALILSIEYIKEDIKKHEEGITEIKKLLKDIEIKTKEEE